MDRDYSGMAESGNHRCPSRYIRANDERKQADNPDSCKLTALRFNSRGRGIFMIDQSCSKRTMRER